MLLTVPDSVSSLIIQLQQICFVNNEELWIAVDSCDGTAESGTGALKCGSYMLMIFRREGGPSKRDRECELESNFELGHSGSYSGLLCSIWEDL